MLNPAATPAQLSDPSFGHDLSIGYPRLSDAAAMALLESSPDYFGLVGSWSVDRHLQEMTNRSSLYFVLRGPGSHLRGFALLQGFHDPHLKVHLKRIVVRDTGQGHGPLLLRQVLSWVFFKTVTNRVDLEVFVGNDRAKRAYEKVGFTVEGLLRDFHRRSDSTFASKWLMSILREEWSQSGQP